MSRQRRLLRTRRKVPDLQGSVVSASDELGVCGCNGEAADGFCVGLYLLDIIEICLPIFHHARLVG